MTLELRKIVGAPDGALLFNFVSAGKDHTWRFSPGSVSEFIALLLGGRLGAGRKVHFDAAKVSIAPKAGTAARHEVTARVGQQVELVFPYDGSAETPSRPTGSGVQARGSARR